LITGARLWVITAKHVHRFRDGQVRVDTACLQDDAHLLLEPPAARSRVKPQDRGPTAVAVPKPFEDLDRGRLAGAVWPQQCEHLPFRDREADTAEGLDWTVGLPKIHDLDCIGGHVASMLAQR